MTKSNIKTATFAGGCFWCTEAVFKRIKGVVSVTPGHIGGRMENPTYEDVSAGVSRHAEAVKIEYDPKVIDFTKLLEIFFATHDPTTPNRQGADVGTQYRSAIFYHDKKQKKAAEKFIYDLEKKGVYSAKIVTGITKASKFYRADMYHHNFYENNKDKPYCKIVISPKLEKLKTKFSDIVV